MNLRYIGPAPTVFNHPQVGPVEPGADFWVDDEDAAGFLARDDIEDADAEQAPEPAEAQPRTRKTRKTSDTAAEPDGDAPPSTPADAQST